MLGSQNLLGSSAVNVEDKPQQMKRKRKKTKNLLTGNPWNPTWTIPGFHGEPIAPGAEIRSKYFPCRVLTNTPKRGAKMLKMFSHLSWN